MTRLIAAALLLAAATGATGREAPPDRFDGVWSVEIVTESGDCDRAYRYPFRIEHGRARLVGTAFAVQGGVARDGALKGTISNGTSTAAVSGRLRADGFGSGTWTASGALACRGRWNAERRG